MVSTTTLIFFVLSASSYIVAAQQNISLGSSLTPTTNPSWKSPSGLFAFGFYQQGNNKGYAVGVFLAGIPEKTVVWTANRDEPLVTANATVVLEGGRLILQQPPVPDRTIADVSQLASSASMLDSGNFVLYDSAHVIIWQTFDNATDTLLPGQRLSVNKQLFSSVSEIDHSTGIFRLIMAYDGHLIEFPVGSPHAPEYTYWQSFTDGNGDNCSLNLKDDGHLYLLNGAGAIIKNLTQAEFTRERKIYMTRIDVDGIFRVYSHTLDQNGSWSITWNSSADKCDPKGLCGLNGYCVLNDTNAYCKCLPGFAPVIPGNWTSGCDRNFAAESCKNAVGGKGYFMAPLDNSVWLEFAYSILHVRSRDECEKACLLDCNCEAALYKDGECKKQSLPLIYARRKLSANSSLALIKVGPSEPIINGVPTVPAKESNKEQRWEILIVGVSLIGFAFLLLAISGFLVHRNQLWAYKKISGKRNVELGEDVALQNFTFTELEQVTNRFNEELGRGSFGTVYKGIIPYNQMVVAVKRLEKVLTEGEREFHAEIKAIGRTYHQNLVRLIGYCVDGANRLLVYSYMANGTLADLLFTPEKQPSWDERIGIARDIARGILYLHEECETQIIHCDIKPRNILIDEKRRAKISDFGLAKLLKPDQTKTTTGIRGTKGYVAPEWHRKLPITVKADVFSFGVVLFEIVCCRKCLDWSLSDKEAVLEEWVYECFEKGELSKLVGEEKVDQKKLKKMIKIGLWCIQDEPSLRPSMKKVLLMLEGTVDIPVPPNPTSFLSAI